MSRSMAVKYFFLLVLVMGLAVVALAQDSADTKFSFQGCRNDGSITLPNPNPPYAGQFICPDTAYTGGELGKGWNELDLVPYRLTASTGKKPISPYSVTIAAGYLTNSGNAGYDIISVPTLNAPLSDGSCTAPSAGAQTIGPSVTNGQGGDQQTIFRNLTISQAANSTCVYDWYQRLAIGSHLNPGASLHSYFFDKSYQNDNYQGHNSDVPIMLGESAGFSVSKTMNAVENTDHDWTVTKTAPSQVMFPNVCSLNQTSNPIQVTVSWQLLPADPFNISVSSTVAVSNNTHRPLNVGVTDNIYSGSDQTNQIGTETGSLNNIAPNTQGVNVPLSPSSLTSPIGPTEFNDVVSATFTDPVVGDTFPGSAAASTAVSDSGGQVYDLASTINDTETLTGSLLAFSTDSFSPAIGAFDNSYVAGTQTTGPVSWTSNSQSGNGSVTFDKTIYFTGSVGVLTSGDLADTATLTGSDYATTGLQRTFSADVKIVTDARVALTIQKNVDFAPATGSQTFNFHVKTSATATNDVTTTSVTFNWPTDGTSKSVVVPDLAAGTYFVTEDPATGWTYDAANSTPQTTITLPSCGGNVVIANKRQAQDLTLVVSATPQFTRTFKWTIQKGANKTLINNPSPVAHVVVGETGFVDSGWQLSGVATVTNPNDWESIPVVLGDSVTGAGSCSFTGSSSLTVGPGQSVPLAYVCTYPAFPSPPSGTDTATATWDKTTYFTPDGSATDSANFTFTGPTHSVNQTVTLTESFNGQPPVALGTLTGTLVKPWATQAFFESPTLNFPASGCVDEPNLSALPPTTLTSSETITLCTSIKSGAKSAGFWALYQGRGLILHGASTANVCNAGTWLRNDAPFQDLSPTASCAQVQSYVTGVFSASSSSVLAGLKMQALATALNVYFSDPSLGGNTISAPAPIGNYSVDLTHVCVMKDSSGTGAGTCAGTVGSSSNAFGGATPLTVSQMLATSSSLSNAGGTAWYSNSATQALAKNAFDAVNNQKAIAP